MEIIDLIVRIILSVFLFFFFNESLLDGKYNRWIRLLIWGVPYTLLGFIGLALEKIGITMFAAFGVVVVCFIYIFICYKDSIKLKGIVVITQYTLILITENLYVLFVSMFVPDIDVIISHNYEINNYAIYFLTVTLGFCFDFFAFYLVSLLIKRIRFKEKARINGLIFMLFPFSQCLLTLVIAKEKGMIKNEDMTVDMTVWIIVGIVVSVIADILCYKGLIQNSELSMVKLRNDHLEREREAQYKYYEKISEMQGEMMKYNHDFKNALQTAYALCESPDELSRKSGAEMLDTLKSRNEEIKAPFFCANPIVNTVLWDKSDEAKKLGIDMEIDANMGVTGIDSVDLCCLIANALDNAIRGVEGSAEKRVDVKIKQEDKRIFMTVKNSARLPDFESSDRIPTTKVGKNHGYGTEIIKSIAERRNGDVLFSCKDNIFTCMATMAEDI